jgi:hypothetical protein
MVAAYLRGLLKPDHPYGIRSSLAEDIVLEALACDNLVHSMEQGLALDMSLLPAITPKAIPGIVQGISRRMGRVNELRGYDIYKVEQQIGDQLKLAGHDASEISVFQVYQIAEKQGIFQRFEDSFDEAALVPLL